MESPLFLESKGAKDFLVSFTATHLGCLLFARTLCLLGVGCSESRRSLSLVS